MSTATGQFIVGNVREGSYVLRFTHRDYEDNPTCTVAVSLGVDDTVITPVQLSYAYYIIRGQVTINGIPQTGAGVCVADYTEGMMTGTAGDFILKHVPKKDSVTLICAYGNVAVATSRIGGLAANDTNDVGTIVLAEKGPTISGIVYNPDTVPMPNLTVFAVAGGLKTTTDGNGYYTLRNVPANEDGVIIMVNEGGYVGAALGASVKMGAVITGCDIYLKPTPQIVNGIKLTTCDVYVPHTAASVICRVYPTTNDVNVVVAEYIWNVGGIIATSTVSEHAVAIAGLSPVTLGAVTAVSTEGDTSATEIFTIILSGTTPIIDSVSVSKNQQIYAPSVSIMEGDMAYFYVHVTDLYGGLATMVWDFGDGSSWAAPDSNPSVGSFYYTAGTYAAKFTASDIDGNVAVDSVTVIVQKSVLAAPVPVSPDSAAVVHVPDDSANLVWTTTPGTGITYNVYLTSQVTIPTEQHLVASGIIDTTFRAAVDSARTYYWQIKAVRASDSAFVRSKISYFTVYTNIVNHAPVFITIPDSMTNTMYVGLPYSDTVQAADVDGDALAFTFIDSLVGMVLADTVFSWTPTVIDTGNRIVSIRASDNLGGYDTLTWTITVIDGSPVITVEPVTKTVKVGNPASFFIVATGVTIGYQWQKDNVDIPNATDSIYAISVTTLADSGMYRCVVTNAFGSDTSAAVKLTVDPFVAPIVYVKHDAAGANNGTSWTDAFTDLQAAIDSADADEQIWVAAGTYKPTKEQGGTGERFRSFSQKTSVAIYGGFAGTETLLSERNWQTNVTICSGDIGVVDDSLDNCYHVFYHTATMLITDKAVLDGFSVSGGNADGTAFHNYGGGMYNVISSPTIRNCTVTKNSAAQKGGGVYNEDRSGTLLYNCTISDNYAALYGGGVYNSSFSSAVIRNCTISANITAYAGGGMYNDRSSVTIDSTVLTSNQVIASSSSYLYGGGGIYNCNKTDLHIINSLLVNNTTPSCGGGIYNYQSSATIDNCTFYNNSSTNFHGGGIHTYTSVILANNCTFASNTANSTGGGMCVSLTSDTAYLTNCTFTNNAANTSNGGGLYLNTNATDSGDVLINCIFWNNFSGSGSHEIYANNDSTFLVKNTIIKGGYPGIDSIIIDDPILGGLEDNGGFVKTCTIDAAGSAIDKGIYAYTDNNGIFISKDGSTFTDVYGNAYTPVGPVTELTTTDARGIARPQGASVDIGAFEKE